MIKNIATTRYVLVAIIVLSFVGIVYFVTKDKRTCAEKGKENDPRKGESGCVEKCSTNNPQNDPFRCVSEKLCKNRDYNGIVKCADCEKGEVAVEKNTGEYECEQECGSPDDCPSNQKCQPVSTKEDTTPPQYCGTATYTCVLDPEQDIMDGKKILVKRGDRGKKCVPSPVGTSLSECLLSGNSNLTTGDDKSCTCNHKKGYALNSQNTACDTVACTEDGINGWGALGTNNIKSTAFNPNVKDEIDGTCYALDSDGLLVNPENDTSECKSAVNKPACLKLNSDGWKCKWLPGVSCERIPIPMSPCWTGNTGWCDNCPLTEVDQNFWKKKCKCVGGTVCCAATQLNVHGDNDNCGWMPYTDLGGITDHATYFIPNCPSQFESDADKQKECKNFYNNGKEKSNKEVGGFNPVTKYSGICWTDTRPGQQYAVPMCSRTNKKCIHGARSC